MKNKDKIRNICEKSKFTVCFNSESNGSMIIPTSALSCISPNTMFKPLPNNILHQDYAVSNKLRDYLLETKFFNNLYKDGNVFQYLLEPKGLNEFLNGEEGYKNLSLNSGNTGYVLPSIVKNTGVAYMNKMKGK